MAIHSITEFVTPSNFEILLSTVKKLAGNNPTERSYGIPTLPVKIRYCLRRCTEVNKTAGISANDTSIITNAKNFLRLYDADWNSRITSVARHTSRKNKCNVQKLLPFCSDVQKLFRFVKEEVFTLCEVSFFNRKRGGEVQRLTVAGYLKGKKSNALDKDILSTLTDFEIQLCKSHTRIEIRGKFGRTVPIILTRSMIDKVDKLIELREKEHITSTYVFSRPVQSTKPYRGSDVLTEIKGMVCPKQPEAFTFTALRKHIATLTQLYEINDTMQDELAQFLGHDIRVHREYYRLPLDIIQKT
ncbi:unnamed protein product [Mytilus coruscus]|uniref:Tyr recombinase domain-containing protein n=1 Tax=Mytilus coruscus TaxID=42192 RepID=A0A6J8F0P7_MYTCO|nr:unnamed protein product [Mytilus coruscus]